MTLMATFGYDMGGLGGLVAAGERAAKAAAGWSVFYGVFVKIIKSEEGREAKIPTRDSARR
jgi:hypothetical protein